MPSYTNTTKLFNLKYANIGEVMITFDDKTTVTKNINQIDTNDDSDPSNGTYFDQGSTRSPVSIDVFGDTWNIADMPVNITYPDGSTTGSMSKTETIDDVMYIKGYEIWLDEIG
jgi:hypothetical protein